MGAACTLATSSGVPPAVLEILEGPGTQHVSPPVNELHRNQDTLPNLVQLDTEPLKGARTLQCSAQASERGVPAERRLSPFRASLPPSRPFSEPFQGPSPPVPRQAPLLARLDNPRHSSENRQRAGGIGRLSGPTLSFMRQPGPPAAWRRAAWSTQRGFPRQRGGPAGCAGFWRPRERWLRPSPGRQSCCAARAQPREDLNQERTGVGCCAGQPVGME